MCLPLLVRYCAVGMTTTIFICDVLKGSPELSISLAFLRLLLLENFHNHCAVHLLILGPGLVVCCSW